MTDLLLRIAVDTVRLGIWLALLAAIFVPLERFFALHPMPGRRPRLLRDTGLFFLNGLLPSVLLGLPLAAMAAASAALVPAGWRATLLDLPLPVRLLASLVVAEIGAYWGHRLSHALPFLWRFHAVHHRAQHVDWLTNSAAHPVDLVFVRLCGLAAVYACGLANIAAGAPDMVPVAVAIFGTVWGFFVHANVRWRFGPFEHLIATPAFHHWHHTRDEHIDRNFSALFPWVDRIFGTLHLPRGEWPKAYGVTEAAARETPSRHLRSD